MRRRRTACILLYYFGTIGRRLPKKAMFNFDTRLQYLKGVGETRAKQFAKLGLYSVGSLLRYYPLRYEDWSLVVPIYDAPLNEMCCIKANVLSAPVEGRTKNNTLLCKTSVSDGSDILNMVFFNNKYISSSLKEGQEYLFFGKLTKNRHGVVEMLSPAFAPARDAEKIRPIYRQSGTLNSKFIERCVLLALSGLKGNIPETLPYDIIKKYRLPSLEAALNNIHFPQDHAALDAAKRRLVFEELLLLQLGLLRMKNDNMSLDSPSIQNDFTGEFLDLLPFKPTRAQIRCVAEAVSDMKKGRSMSRLLSGDVGSGKTAVAAAIMYSVCKNGFQCAMMVPTEVLAAQHFATLTKMYDTTGICVEPLTGSTPAKEKRRIKDALINGNCHIVVGTHAIIQSDVSFSNLGLVITDEQHRFGVAQRAALGVKGKSPHMLVMSATPIPRTLAMVVYGDLDVSLLDEMPVGRVPVKTYQVTTAYRNRIYAFIKKHIDKGRQAFVICPLVEESKSGLVPAVQYFEFLRDTHFKKYKIGLLHGQMKSGEKYAVMSDFSSGKISLLVSTIVIEVGIDLPNANVMLIENAERFGLSQLHQLRGRIGRGSEQSFCILVSDAQSSDALERFDILCKNTDGFAIADKDLQMRGPGDFFGNRQHGLPEMQIASLMTDSKALLEAGKAAKEIIKADAFLKEEEHKNLLLEIERLFTVI